MSNPVTPYLSSGISFDGKIETEKRMYTDFLSGVFFVTNASVCLGCGRDPMIWDLYYNVFFYLANEKLSDTKIPKNNESRIV